MIQRPNTALARHFTGKWEAASSSYLTLSIKQYSEAKLKFITSPVTQIK